MPKFQHPYSPTGRVMVRGVEFIDGVSADIEPSADTLAFFNAYDIVELPAEQPVTEPEPVEAHAEPEIIRKSRK